MSALETFLEKATRRFDAIETHEEGYDWARRHGPELMERLAAAERVVEAAKLYIKAQRSDDCMWEGRAYIDKEDALAAYDALKGDER